VEVLLDNPHVTITRDKRLVRITRSALPYETIGEFEAMTDTMSHAMRNVARATHGLLLDLRVAPLRAGDDFDMAAARYAREIFTGFAKVAVLVGSPVGRLQIQRFEREHRGPRYFMNEAEALSYVEVR
jgi:hypothetical protein